LSCAINVLIDIICIKHNRYVFVNVKIWTISGTQLSNKEYT